MQNFWFTDDWTPNMFQQFMLYCWTNNWTPTPPIAKDWRRNIYKD